MYTTEAEKVASHRAGDCAKCARGTVCGVVTKINAEFHPEFHRARVETVAPIRERYVPLKRR